MTTLQKRRDQLRTLYGFDWPDDLFRFWEFGRAKLKPLEPLSGLYETLNISLLGPFEVLDGRFDGRLPNYSPLLHWRYYMDPPEFFTLLVGDEDGLHWGYVLDDPRAAETLVAMYYANDAFEMELYGEGLFETVRRNLEFRIGEGQEAIEFDMDEDGDWADLVPKLERLRDRLIKYGTAERTETGDEYVEKYNTRLKRARRQRIIADTPDRLGVVVAPEQYRPLKLNDKSLRRRLENDKDVTAVIRAAHRAVKEGFPGTALKLGKELWVAGPEHAADAFALLDAAYEALGRDVLRAVVREHRAHRDRPWLDVLHDETS